MKFDSYIDRWNGIHVAIPVEENGIYPISEFEEALSGLFELINEKKLRAIWFKLRKGQTQFIEKLLHLNFYFHHAEGTHTMLCKWLDETLPNALPHYSSFHIGIGGFVVNDQNEVLVVQEKNSPIPNFWKIPGGHVEPNEDLDQAVIREIFEETGIKTEFEKILTFRQANNAAFQRADIFFVAKLRPLTTEIKKCEIEIAACKWMPLEEYFSLPFYKGVYLKMRDVQKESLHPDYQGGFTREILPSGIGRGTNRFYYSKL